MTSAFGSDAYCRSVVAPDANSLGGGTGKPIGILCRGRLLLDSSVTFRTTTVITFPPVRTRYRASLAIVGCDADLRARAEAVSNGSSQLALQSSWRGRDSVTLSAVNTSPNQRRPVADSFAASRGRAR